jgi:ATP-dependent exoDNAse (exonuclease V) beta subunit
VGCPAFGLASVLVRPMEYDQSEEASVRPGLIQPEAGSHEVVWWDPSKLKLGEESSQTVSQDQMLARTLKEDGGASLATYRAWQQDREALLERGSRPEVEVFVASQAAEAPPGTAIGVEYFSAVAAPRAAGGKRFGTLVHAVLRDAALDAKTGAIRKLAEMNARVLGAPKDEAKAAHTAVVAALAHPVLESARRAARCHREYPLTLAMANRRVLEGVIDLAFVEDGGWVVVDFKTDADSAERRAQYERQLQWYAFALAELTGVRARGILLGV